jgi:hypothetical protein
MASRAVVIRLLALLLLALLCATADQGRPLLAAEPASAGSFNPAFEANTGHVDALTPSDLTLTLSLPPGDVNFSASVVFVPEEWGIVRGDSIPIDTKVGTANGFFTSGLVNRACDEALPEFFDLRNGSLDITDTVAFNDANRNMFNVADFAEDANDNGVADGIEEYPDWLNRMFSYAQPLRRFAGVTIVAGWPVILQVVVFPPGTAVHPSIPADPELGLPFVVVLQNFGDPSAPPPDGPANVTDFCTPLEVEFRLQGTQAPLPQLFVNPDDGTYTFTAVSLGLRDADGDGYENALDTCPFTANIGNPRVQGSGDLDQDGIDAACDADDGLPPDGITDEDGDGHLNRGDNCPYEPNGQRDVDFDQIGDGCDPAPASSDGDLPFALRESVVHIGEGGEGPGAAPTDEQCPACWREAPSVPLQGGILCQEAVGLGDLYRLMQHSAGLESAASDCPPINGPLIGGFPWGDVNCDGAVHLLDALLVLAFIAGQPHPTTEGCTPIGMAIVQPP